MSHKNMAGKMDKRISILRETQTDDGHNGKTSTFTKLCDAWSEVFLGSGTENYRFGRVFEKDNYVFVIYNRPELTINTDDIVEFECNRMDIKHVTKIDNRSLYMAIEAVKGAGV